jgi:hypothetical protein
VTTLFEHTEQLHLENYYAPHAGRDGHSGQAAVHASPARVKVLEVGRRWGKSRCALGELIYTYLESLQLPVSSAVIPPFHAWAVVPTENQGRQTWNEMLSIIPREFIFRVNQDEKTITLRGTADRPWGLIEMKSAFNPDSLQTVGLDFLWVSEAQDVDDNAYARLLPTLRSPERMRRAIFEGIPSLVADHWFHKLYVVAERGRDDHQAFKATAFDNPLISDEIIHEMEEDRELLTQDQWARYYLAQFSASAGGLRNIDRCIAGDLLPAPLPDSHYVAGLDLGRRQDATVLTIMDPRTRRVVGHYRWDSHENWVLQREGVMHECLTVWEIERLVVDATGLGDVFADELIQAGLPVEPYVISSSTREPLLNALAIALERETVSFPPVPELLRELRALQPRKVSNRYWRLEASPGNHDDEVFALALALTACEPAHEVAPLGRRLGRRYLPTQAEASTGIRQSEGAKQMRQRQVDRMQERAERAGVV